MLPLQTLQAYQVSLIEECTPPEALNYAEAYIDTLPNAKEIKYNTKSDAYWRHSGVSHSQLGFLFSIIGNIPEAQIKHYQTFFRGPKAQAADVLARYSFVTQIRHQRIKSWESAPAHTFLNKKAQKDSRETKSEIGKLFLKNSKDHRIFQAVFSCFLTITDLMWHACPDVVHLLRMSTHVSESHSLSNWIDGESMTNCAYLMAYCVRCTWIGHRCMQCCCRFVGNLARVSTNLRGDYQEPICDTIPSCMIEKNIGCVGCHY